ncbi:hypothetical protein JP35_07930, partial [Gallibacterium anatis]|uniref:hypothetical protein n=1 Tax=Gallibacterium anatis TaxID=750 RepID=UPI0005320BF3
SASESVSASESASASESVSASESASASESESLSALDRDNDGYFNDVEDAAGSNPDDDASTPKTIADDLYKEAEEFLNSMNDEKTNLESGGFTKPEVQHLKENVFKLETLKQKAFDATQYVKETDGRQELINKLNKLTFVIPEVTNDANTQWARGTMYDLKDDAGKIITRSFADYRDKDINELAKTEQKFSLPANSLLDPDLADTDRSPTIVGPTEWTATKVNPSGGGYTEYKVENGQVIFRIDPYKAALLSGNTNESFILETDDGSKVRAIFSFTGTAELTSVVNIVPKDDVGLIQGIITHNSVTNDNNWNNVKVVLNKSAEEEVWVKLLIKDLTTGQVLGEKIQSIISSKEIEFDLSEYQSSIKDGRYSLEAVRIANSAGQPLGTEVPVRMTVNIDTVAPSIQTSYELGSDGQAYVRFTTQETGISWSTDKSNLQNTFDTRESMNGELRFEVKSAPKYFFFDQAGNYTEVSVVPPSVLARLTTNMTTETGPNDWLKDYNDGQHSAAEQSLKTTTGDDYIFVAKLPDKKDEYAGFIDGGTSVNAYSITLDTSTGNDTIIARGIGGHTNVKTGAGNDKISLEQGIIGYGPSNVYYGGMDGPQLIDMGAGDDVLSVGKFTMWGNQDSVNSFFKTTTKILMGEGNDTITTGGTIWADSDATQPYSNYINLGAGNDTMIVGGQLADTYNSGTNIKHASNVIDLGAGNDTLTIKGAVLGNALILSDDSSTITIGERVSGKATFLLGDQDDKLTFKDNVYISSNETIAPVVSAYQENNTYGGIKQGWYKESATKLDTLNTDMKPFIDLGNGNNTVTFEKELIGGDIKSGNGDDIINMRYTISETKISTGEGEDKVSVERWNTASNIDIQLGDGNDTITVDSMGIQKEGEIPKVFKNVVDGGNDYDVFNAGDAGLNLSMYSTQKLNNISLLNIEEVNLNGNSTLTVGTSGGLDVITVSNKDQYEGLFFINGTNNDTVKFELPDNNRHQWTLSRESITVDGYSGITYNEYTYKVDGIDTNVKLYLDTDITKVII